MPDKKTPVTEQEENSDAATPRIIVIGASASGFEVLKKIIRGLPPGLNAAIFIVWHMSPDLRGILPQVLNKENNIPAANAYHNEPIRPNRIYVAPADHHMMLEENRILITHGPKENRFRPAVDPLFRSAAYTHGNRVIGMVLSGALDDGTAGLWTVKHYGGIAIVQDPMDAEVPSMPENALREVKVDYSVSAANMPGLLVRLLNQPLPEKVIVTKDEQTKTEIDIAAEQRAMEKGVSPFNSLTPYTCPECHGVLSRLQNDNIIRYRCHIGHAYSADSLLAAITERVEDNLYSAIRGMDETVMLLNHVGDHYAEDNQPDMAALYFTKAKQAEERAQLVRKAVLLHEQMSLDTLRGVDCRYLEVNPVFEKQVGQQPDVVLGKTVRELFPSIEDWWLNTLGKVAETRQPCRFERYVPELDHWYEVFAYALWGNEVAVLYNNITDRKKAETALLESEERQAFLLKLSDELRTLRSSVTIQQTASRLTGEFLGADRAAYGEWGPATETLEVMHDWYRPGVDTSTGRFRLMEFGAFLVQLFHAGEDLVVEDAANDTRVPPEVFQHTWSQTKVRAVVAHPLIKAGKFVATFFVHQVSPRAWKEGEISLLAEVAERTWAAVERARAEEALALSEEKYRHLFDSMDEGYCIIQMLYDEVGKANNWRFLQVNRAFAHNNGLYNAEGKTILDTTPDIEPKWFEIYDRVAQSGEPLRFEEDSVALHRNFSLYAFRIGAPEERKIAVIFTDITERSRAQEALRTSETRFRILADAIPQVIWANNAEGHANYFNQRWYQFSGLNYEASAGPGWQAIVHPDDAPASVEKWARALEEGKTFDTEYRLRRHDGSYCWFIGRNVPVKDEAGIVTGWFGSATDIEALKKATEALSQSETRLKITMESATDYAIITMDTDRSIERWSNGASRIFGYSEEEVLGRSADIIFTDEDREAGAPEAEVSIATDTGRAADERWHQRKDGSRFYMSGVTRPIYYNGELTGFVKVARDTTRQQLFTEELHRLVDERTLELQRSNEDLRQFAHVASHDLKEPVRKIQTFNNRIMREFGDTLPEKVKVYLQKIASAGNRMYAMIDGVLAYSMVGNAKQQAELVDLTGLLQDIAADLEVLIQEKHAQLHLTPLPQLSGYRVLLYQLFYNLILNSLKFSRAGEPPVIQVKYEPIDQQNEPFHKIIVADNGIGFDQDYATTIFSTFTRLHSMDEYEGTGLGLALCRKIVDRHKGHISATGIVNGGATFTVLLPV